MTQITFPVKAQSQLEEKFLEFHAKHPEVYAALSRFCLLYTSDAADE